MSKFQSHAGTELETSSGFGTFEDLNNLQNVNDGVGRDRNVAHACFRPVTSSVARRPNISRLNNELINRIVGKAGAIINISRISSDTKSKAGVEPASTR